MTLRQVLQGVLAATVLLLTSTPGRAHVLSDNMSEAPMYKEVASAQTWIGVKFTTDGQAWNLSSVSLLGYVTGSPENVIVALYSNVFDYLAVPLSFVLGNGFRLLAAATGW